MANQTVLDAIALGAFRFLPLRALRRTQDALAFEKERAQVALGSIRDGVISTDARGVIEHANPVALQIGGWTREALVGRPLGDVFMLVSERTRESIPNPLAQALGERRVVQSPANTLLVRRDSGEVAIESSAAPICDARGEVVGGVVVFHDVSAARELNRKLSWQATHDALTGLVNRVEFERHLQLALDNAHATGAEHAICFLDLDQFKVVNDSCGHVAGDELLRELTEILKSRVRSSDVLARLGGDEFGLLLHGCSLERAQQIAREMLQGVGDFRFRWDGQSFSVGMSIGLVSMTRKTESTRVVLSAADAACFAAKENGRNRIQAYSPQDADLAQRREQMGWVARLSRALDEDRLVLHHQPYLGLSAESGEAKHVELLLRMIDEDGGLVLPGTFIPVAERYNLMSALDRWVIRAAMAGYDKLVGRYGPGVVMSINLSGASVTDETLAATIIQRARDAGVPPSAVCFEITETTAVNHLRRAAAFMSTLKALGFRFALDDFGSGMSSFAYLKALPVDYLKIDGSFVRDIASDRVSRTLTEAMNQIGHAMDLRTIAECVESEGVLQALRAVGVDYAQGHVIARPMPIDVRQGLRLHVA